MSCLAISRWSPSLSAPTARRATQARYRSFRDDDRGMEQHQRRAAFRGKGQGRGRPSRSCAETERDDRRHRSALRVLPGRLRRRRRHLEELGFRRPVRPEDGCAAARVLDVIRCGGLPILPLLVRYDEAARGEIKHPFRVCISPGLSRNRFVWPAATRSIRGQSTTGLPWGPGRA